MIGQRLGRYRIVEKMADENARKRFHKEALALSKFNHANIGTIHDFDSQGGVDFLVMEHIPGVTLSDKLAAGALPENEVVRLGAQLAEGLAAAHEQGLVHRDLKPANLRLTTRGRLKILDFGLAKLPLRLPGGLIGHGQARTELTLGYARTFRQRSQRGHYARADQSDAFLGSAAAAGGTFPGGFTRARG